MKTIPIRDISDVGGSAYNHPPAHPDDTPGTVALLASDHAAFITGQTISVSGGLSMHG